MDKLETKIKSKEETLARITPQYNEKKASESEISTRCVFMFMNRDQCIAECIAM